MARFSAQVSKVQAVAAGGVVMVSTTGILTKLQPGQALWVKAYSAGLSDPVTSNALVFFAPGTILAEKSPFGVANGLRGYQGYEIPELLQAALPGSGVIPPAPGDIVTLIEDWYEANDYSDVVSGGIGAAGIQLQTFWQVKNTSAGALNVNMTETLLGEIYGLIDTTAL